MRKRKFIITDNMLVAGEAALRDCYKHGGHDIKSICRAIFLAMLDVSACSVLPAKSIKRPYWTLTPKLQGHPLPPTIFHPDRFPDDRACRGCYWYLASRYDADLRKILADPKQCAKLKFWSVDVVF